MKNSEKDLPELFPDEEILLHNPHIGIMIVYFLFLGTVYFNPRIDESLITPKKKILVTNKRVVMSFRWSMGITVESLADGISCYYTKEDLNTLGSPSSNWLKKIEIGKGKIFGNYVKLFINNGLLTTRVKIYSKESQKIYDLISKHVR